MDATTNLLHRISHQLDQLTSSFATLRQQSDSHLDRLRQEMVRLSQETTWDVNMLRQEMATQQNLRGVAESLASRQDLAHAIETLGRRLGGLRFESHREHQELLRFMDEGPYGLARPAAPKTRTDRIERRELTLSSARSTTLSADEVLELEQVGDEIDRSDQRAASACSRITAAA